KHPATRNGLKDATTSRQPIRKHWRECPDDNIGLVTGASSGLVVLDVDAGKDGLDTLATLEAQHGPLPDTATVETGGGGRHYYFRHPGIPIKSNVGRLGPGLDVRA